jgi:hypothetical protein
METQLPSVPSGYSKIHHDLRGLTTSRMVIFSWVVWSFTSMGLLYLGWLGLCLVVLLLAWPVLTVLSRKENQKIFCYLTWAFENTESVKAHVKVSAVHAGEINYHLATITTNAREYKCELVARSIGDRELECIDMQMDLHFLPNTDEPLVATAGDTRLWFVTNLTNETMAHLEGISTTRNLSPEEIAALDK